MNDSVDKDQFRPREGAVLQARYKHIPVRSAAAVHGHRRPATLHLPTGSPL
ncbi:hypothetical protein [Ketobacter sp.]|uniref:hypothetical protein n=1 Tax=Ketobacter sp. TaxID=2083498 RepID=UPI0025B8F4A4|nr:hypothetical protein [Ketobacter sp.]